VLKEDILVSLAHICDQDKKYLRCIERYGIQGKVGMHHIL